MPAVFTRRRSRPDVSRRDWARACAALGADFEQDLVAAQLDELAGVELFDAEAMAVVRASMLDGVRLAAIVTTSRELVLAAPGSPIAAKFVSPSLSVLGMNRRARFRVTDVALEGRSLLVTVTSVRSVLNPRVREHRFYCDAARVALVVPGLGAG